MSNWDAARTLNAKVSRTTYPPICNSNSVLFLDHEASWPSTKERTGYWIGVCKNIGDMLTFWIYDDVTRQVVARSVVRPATGNLRVKWDPQLKPNTTRKTAKNGGDNYPNRQEMKNLLLNDMDKHDARASVPSFH